MVKKNIEDQCNNGKCRRIWQCCLVTPRGGQVHLCADCGNYFLILRDKEKNIKKVEDFLEGCK